MHTLLKHPVFGRLYAAHIIHILGNEFTFIAVLGLLHDLSGSGLSFAAGTIFRMIPYVLTGIFAGALLERWDKRKVMMVVNLARGALVALYFFVTDAAHLWIAFLLMILINIFTAFFTPAMQVAIVQSVSVEQRLAANSLLQATTSFLIIVCQGMAAFLVYYFSYRFNFLFDSACYFLSLLILLKLPSLKGTMEETVSSFSQRLRDGFRYVKEQREIRQVMLMQMAERICGAYYIMLMFFILQERGQGLYIFGLLDIPLGIGGVIAGTVAGKLAARLGERGIDKLMGFALIGASIGILAMFHSGPLSALMVMTLVTSFASFLFGILAVTRLQRIADPAFLARVFSIREMGTAATYSLGCLIVGYAAEKVGSPTVSWGLAIWGIAAGILWLVVRQPASSKEIG